MSRGMLTAILASSFFAACSNISKKQVPELTEFAKFSKIYEEASKIPYKAEPADQDYWQTPEETKKLNSGDCEDHAIYVLERARKAGIASRMVVGFISIKDEQEERYHAWNEVVLDNKTYIVDSNPGLKLMALRKDVPYILYIEVKDNKKFNDKMKNITVSGKDLTVLASEK